MKKAVSFLLTTVFCLSMSVNVFAAVSPSVDNRGEVYSPRVDNSTVAPGSQQILFEAADGTAMNWVSSEQNNDIAVSGTLTNIPSGAVFNANRIISGDEAARVASAVASAKGNVAYVAYDFTLDTAGGQPITRFNGHIDVTMPVPSGLTAGEGEVLSVYYVTNAGKLEKCNSVVTDNMVTFGTTHFSTYVYLVESAASAAASPASSTSASPKTTETNMSLYMTMLAIAALGTAVYGARKVKYNK